MNSKKKRARARRENRQLTIRMRQKLAVLFMIVLLALIGLAAYVIVINVTRGKDYKKIVMEQVQAHYESRVVPARRGDIYDTKGNVLATSNLVYNVIIDCRRINENEECVDTTVEALVNWLGCDEEKVRKFLASEETRDRQYVVVNKGVSMEDKKAYEVFAEEDYNAYRAAYQEELERRREMGLPTDDISIPRVIGIWMEEDYVRFYPYRQLACDTLGFADSRDSAVTGLESYYNTTLTGSDGRQYGYFDGISNIEQTIIETTAGNSIETTLDMDVQRIVEKYVDAFNTRIGAKNVGVLVMEPSTGAILAMDGGDRYDLNAPRDISALYTEAEIKDMDDSQIVDILSQRWRNFCVTDTFEPGSVAKPIFMAGALEKGRVGTGDIFTCDGYENFGTEGHATTIKCAVYPSAHGKETLGDIIANSCNDGMMQIAAKVGADQFIKIQNLFNLGSLTGIDLPNEAAGIVHSLASMGETELACTSFGQGYTCTMIQEACAICSVINGGYYYKPQLLKKIRDSSGNVLKTYSPVLVRQTVTATISHNLREYMKLSVTNGTSYKSRMEGYSTGGKTGTAEKYPRGNGKYLVSFIGFAPVENPKVLVYVVVDEPNVEDQASSSYAQYIAQGIYSELLPYMGIPADEAIDGYVPATELWEGFTGLFNRDEDSFTDSEGVLRDMNGNRIDFEGNRIDENGYLLDANGNYRYDANGYYMKSTHLVNTEARDGISDASVPGPLEDNSNPIRGNTMESEGLTNEEASL